MTYLCEDSRRSERTSREDVKSCGCGSDESGEHCGLWEKKWRKRGKRGGTSCCRIYICKLCTKNGNQTCSVGNQPRINKSQAPHTFTRLIALAAGPARVTYIHRHHSCIKNATTAVVNIHIHIYIYMRLCAIRANTCLRTTRRS